MDGSTITDEVDILHSSGDSASLPVEIVNIILKNLGTSDLLNCRLVSTCWNKLCVGLLKKSSAIYCLPWHKIKEYNQFVTETNPKIVGPFRISIEDSYRRFQYEDFEKDLDSLIQLAGPESIVAVRLEIGNAKYLFTILRKLSCGLRSLERIISSLVISSPNLILFREQSFTFPKLRKIVCGVDCRYAEDMDYGSRLEFYSMLVERSPELQELDYCAPLQIGDLHMKIPFRQLNSLTLGDIRDWRILLNQIRASPWKPRLQYFKFSLDSDSVQYSRVGYDLNKNAMTAVLEEFSPTLRSMCFKFVWDDATNERIVFPIMPVLEKLQFKLGCSKSYSRGLVQVSNVLYSSTINFTPSHFPALKSVGFPAGLTWGWDPDEATQFPNVNKVTLEVFEHNYECATYRTSVKTSEYIQMFAGDLFSTFPNIMRLSVDNTNCKDELFTRRVITQVITHPKAGSILEFGITDYKRDYLGESLRALEHDHQPEAILTLKNFPHSVCSEKAGEIVKRIFDEMGIDTDNYSAGDDYQERDQLEFTTMNTAATGPYILYATTKRHVHYLNNVKRIRLEQAKDTFQENVYFRLDSIDSHRYIGFHSHKEIMYLDSIQKQLPNLRSLELSSNILAKHRMDAWRRAREIEEKFANWTVNLIESS